MEIETIRPMTPMVPTAAARLNLNCSCRNAIGASYRLTIEETPANRTQMKNTTPMIRPPGIALNTFTR